MRIGIALLSLVLVMAGGCSDDERSGDDPGAPEPLDWSETVTDDALGIEFRLPIEPERLVQRLQLPDGSESELVVYAAGVDDRELFVSVLPLDPDTYELSGAAPGAANAVDGELVTVGTATVEGRPARDAEITFERDGTAQLLLYRAVLLENGLLQLQTIGAEADRDDLERYHAALLGGVSWR